MTVRFNEYMADGFLIPKVGRFAFTKGTLLEDVSLELVQVDVGKLRLQDEFGVLANLEIGGLNIATLDLTKLTLSDGTFASPALAFAAQSTFGLLRLAADVAALSPGTSQSVLHIAAEGVDITNMASLRLSAAASAVGIHSFATAAPILRTLQIGTLGAKPIEFSTNNLLRWTIDESGHVIPGADILQDFGSAALRGRTGYFGTSVITPQIDSGSAAVQLQFSLGGVNYWGITTTGALIPLTNDAYDVGTTTRRVKEVFVDGYLSVGTDLPATSVRGLRFGSDPDGTLISGRQGGSDVLLVRLFVADRQVVLGDTLTGPTAIATNLSAVSVLANGYWWLEASGTSPSRTIALKCRDAGVTRTIAAITY